ncbi:MAG TPA: hypothetical protein VGA16_08860 [Candidatus Limnocylindria bacterium]
MPASVEVQVERGDGGWTATVGVEQRGSRTEHRVTVRDEDLARYRATDAADLVRRSFEFLLAREPNTSILREFRITEIERYFPEYASSIRGQ